MTGFDAVDRAFHELTVAQRNAAWHEIERLQAWKNEALAVLAEWETVWEAAGRPGALGHSKAEAVRDWIKDRT